MILAVLALTVAAMLVWFWRVFRRLRWIRNIDRRWLRNMESIAEGFRQLGITAEGANEAFLRCGETMRAAVKSMVAALSPKQREIYDELRAIGALPIDAIYEACARWPD